MQVSLTENNKIKFLNAKNVSGIDNKPANRSLY